MNSLNIGTSQNVAIEYDVANIGDRFLALLIDQLVIVGMILVLAFGGFILSDLLGTNMGPVIFLVYIPLFFYHFICEITMNGQSIGKRARKIKVIKKDGVPATLSSYFLRFLLRPIDSFYGIGLLVILINGKGQRLGDLAAGTTVVKLKEKVKLEDLLHVTPEENYEPVFHEVIKLTDKDIGIIKTILVSRKGEKHHHSIVTLANKIKSVLDVESHLPPYDFLEQILKDYNYYHAGG